MAYHPFDVAFEVASGGQPGITGVNKFGHSFTVGTTWTDIIDDGTNVIWDPPTTARIHNIASSNAGDTSAGAGARTIRVFGLTAWDQPETYEDVIMNGTSNVPTVNAYVIIHRMWVSTKGNNGLPNIGTITATAQTDGTVTAQINPGNGQTQMAVYGVPDGKTLYLADYYTSLIADPGLSRDVDISLVVNPEPDVQLAGFVTKHTQGVADAGSSFVKHKFSPYYPIHGPAIIKMQGIGSASGIHVSAGFNGYLATPQG